MHKLSRQKIAAKLSELNEEKGRLEEELDEAIEKVAAHEKRQMAEDILIKAHQADEVPSKLKPASVEDFFAKRAQLEEKSPDELEKLAALVEVAGEGIGAELVDSVPSSENNDPSDFTGWLRSKVGRV